MPAPVLKPAQFEKRRWADPAPSPKLKILFPFGLNENVTPNPGECSYGYNFDLAPTLTSFRPRAPFDLAGTTPNAGAITGFMQLVKRDSTQTTVVASGNQVYKWDGTSSGFTSVGSITSGGLLRGTYWSLGDYLVITDVALKNVVGKWDGTTFGALTTGLGSSLYAKYAVVFNNRVWLFNITYGSTAYPNMMLASYFENPNSFDTSTRGGPTTIGGGTFSTGLEAFYLLTPDLKPINGVTIFKNTLIFSTTEGQLWQLTGTQSANYQVTPFYGAQPAIGTEAIANVGDDIVYVKPGGAISLLSATLDFGNVYTSNLSSWLPTTTANLSTVNQIAFDVVNQKVLLFVPGKVLALYRNMLAQEGGSALNGPSPWSVYLTNDTSNFNTSAALYMYTPGTSNFNVYWGDTIGRVFAMNGTGSGDAGSQSITALRTTRHISADVVNPWPWTEKNITGEIAYKRLTQVSATVQLQWDDEYNTTQAAVTLKGPTSGTSGVYYSGKFYYSGTSYYSQGFSFRAQASHMNIEPGGKGPGFYATVSVGTNQPFEIDAINFT